MVTIAKAIEMVVLFCIFILQIYLLFFALPEANKLYEDCNFITLCESGALKYNTKCETWLKQKENIQIVNVTI